MINVLFIGNSFTYYNDMIRTFEDISKANGFDVHSDQIAYGGYSLIQYINEKDKNDELITKINSRRWDYVVLQDHSRKALDNLDELYEAVKELAVLIRDQGGEPLLYSTWSYREGSAILRNTELSYDALYDVIRDGYSEVGKKLDIEVVDIGKIFKSLHRQVNLLTEDDLHPNLLGSYIIAYRFYKSIFKKINEEYRPKKVSEDEFSVVNLYFAKNF